MESQHKHSPLISIIIAVLNNEKTLKKCIESIVNQSYPNWELIIIDGQSKDNSTNIIETYTKNIAYWESEKDDGIYHAWNKALKETRGEWIYFLGADDFLWEPNAIEQMIPYLIKAYPENRIVYANVVSVIGKKNIEYQGAPWDKKKFLNTMYFSHQGVMHHKSIFETLGPFDTTFDIAGDYDMLMRELKYNSAYYVDNLILAGTQIGGKSNGSEFILSLTEEVKKIRKKNEINTFSFPLFYDSILRHIWVFLIKHVGEQKANRLADIYRKCTFRKSMYSHLR